MVIERVCWPIAAPGSYDSRPQSLVGALQDGGFVQPKEFEFHSLRRSSHPGRRGLTSLATRRGHVLDTAVLSPLFIHSEIGNSTWVDVYDDWSLAPEMSRVVKGLAFAGYETLRRSSSPRTLITCNSRFMRDRLAPRAVHHVPNGVDPGLPEWETAGAADETRRLVMIGNFFEGRTDWALMAKLATSSACEQVAIYGAPRDFIAKVERARNRIGPDISFHPKTPMREIAKTLGARTVIGVPHVVSDYTMSQDLMKAYQAVALGCRVALPLELVPDGFDVRHVVTFGLGVEVDAVLEVAFSSPPITESERRGFALENSWRVRAQTIGGLLSEL